LASAIVRSGLNSAAAAPPSAPMSDAHTPSTQAFADLLRPARRVVVFTGAGVSTESGIPDFRSPGGIWSQMKPITAGPGPSPTPGTGRWPR